MSLSMRKMTMQARKKALITGITGQAVHYRESYGILGSSGILFKHLCAMMVKAAMRRNQHGHSF